MILAILLIILAVIMFFGTLTIIASPRVSSRARVSTVIGNGFAITVVCLAAVALM